LSATNDATVKRYALPGAPDPILPQDLATKAYVDQEVGNIVNELEFLQLKSAAGKLRHLTALRSTVGAFFTITPPIGTTTVIYKAQVVSQGGTIAAYEFDLTIDAVIIEEYKLHEPLATNVGQPITFISKGIELIGDGIKTIVMNLSVITAAEDVFASLEAYDL